MSRLKGCVAAGLRIWNTKPATLTRYGRLSCLLLAGPVALIISISTLVGVQGSSVPVPPRKPDVASLIRDGMVNAASSPVSQRAAMRQSSYRSPFAGPQMDLYRDIFRFQAAGSFVEADRLIGQLSDRALMGHVLAQRFLHVSYKAGFAELSGWLASYADHPQAERIARLASIRAPQGGGSALPKVSYSASSIETFEQHGMEAKSYEPEIKRNGTQNAQAKDLIKSVRRHIQIYEPSAALRLFNESPVSVYLDSVEKDRIRALVASGYLYAGKVDEAERLSAQALNSARGKAPMAGWVHGLAKWRQGRYAQAAQSFEIAAYSPYSSGDMVAASAYWAARAHVKAGHDRRYKQALKLAADYPRTFYGMLALSATGRDLSLNWDAPQLAKSQERELMDSEAALRAEKLLAAGEVALAEAEIRALYIKGNAERKKALLAYAYDRQLPSLTMRLAHATGPKGKEAYDAALYPAMPWTPNQGFRIDRALIHAIIRQESRFNALAESSAGATGLMQIMPRTANHIASSDIFTDREGRNLLKTAEINLDLGQKYVEELLNSPLVGQDLLSLAIAYNAGPGTLARWKSERADIDDPLLFIETIPYAETRAYVERVLSNYWIYRMRFDQPDESMMELATSRWPRYAALDKGAIKFASAE